MASEFSDTLFSYFRRKKTTDLINDTKDRRPYGDDRFLSGDTFYKILEVVNAFYQSNKSNYERLFADIENMPAIDSNAHQTVRYYLSVMKSIVNELFLIYQLETYPCYLINKEKYKWILDALSDNKLWVLTLNHNILVELLCIDYDIPLREGYFFLTPAGRLFLNRHNDLLQFLLDNQFSYSDMIALLQSSTQAKNATHKPKLYSENDTIQEGLSETKTTEAKKRSKKLRDYAVEYYKSGAEDKKLHCHVCNFCFEDFYGNLGVDYIEMHHEKPLCQYPDQGLEQFLLDAVAKVKPVCSNCHRMLHRSRRSEPLTTDQLKMLISSNSIE